MKWYKLSAAQGDALAQYNLGNMYEEGLGVEVNYEEAIKWYKLAAAQGDTYAKDKLNYIYKEVLGVRATMIEKLKKTLKKFGKNNK